MVTTHGSLWWIADLGEYLAGIAGLLDPGGWYVICDFHPLLLCMDGDGTPGMPFPVSSAGRDHPMGISDYVLGSTRFHGTGPVRYYVHSLAAIISAGALAGLRVISLREMTSVHGERFIPAMAERPGGRFGLAGDYLPLSFLLVFAAPQERR